MNLTLSVCYVHNHKQPETRRHLEIARALQDFKSLAPFLRETTTTTTTTDSTHMITYRSNGESEGLWCLAVYKSIYKLRKFTAFMLKEAYDPLDPSANITITWDITTWTYNGYTATVTMYNFQQYRHIQSPGWQMGWTWAKEEFIWGMMGAQTTEQGDCSKIEANRPHCCKKTPNVVDLMPGIPYNQQTANCCKGGVLSAWAQDPVSAASSFNMVVGNAWTNYETVRLPKSFTLKGPGPGYTCGPAKIVKPSRFLTPDKRRVTQALMTWSITCTYSQFLAQKRPTCCVSMSAFYNDRVVPCQNCACGCQNNLAETSGCVNADYSRVTQDVPATGMNGYVPPLVRYDTALLWGVKFYNDLLQTSGPTGHVQSELLFQKDLSTFTLYEGWAFPRRVYFNGDSCVMPLPDEYPRLPNASSRFTISCVTIMVTFLTALVFLLGQA
ncbi:hypothetical protein ACFE04_006396 [Oxalis oulophora]